jgi:hypothetical protein
MKKMLGPATLVVCLSTGALAAQASGTASGKGVIERTGSNPGQVGFSPKYSYVYKDGSGARASTWIVLTEKDPPVKEWSAAKDRAGARQAWCGKEKTPWAAVKLDAQMKVDLYFLCPADGGLNTEMVSSMNGLESVVVKTEGDGKRLRGTIRTGQGNCPTMDGKDAYCTPTGDYKFEAPVSP